MIIVLFITIVFAIGISIKFNKKSSECLPTAILGIVFILYVFGIFNLFKLGLVILLLLLIITIIYVLNKIIYKKENIFDHIDVGTFAFIILVGILFYIVRGSKIICYDEFTAWGMFAKTSFESKSLYIYSEYQALAKQYASGTAIFQTFVEIFNFNFSEDLLFVATDIIYLSFGVSILKNLKWKNIIDVIFRSIIIFFLPYCIYMWPTFYYTILVDIILGFVAGYVLFTYFTSNLDKFSLLNISLGIFFLTCTKGNGLLLALICLGIIYADLLFFKIKDIYKYINVKNFRQIWRKENTKSIIVLLLPVLSAIFTFLSWNICIKVMKISAYSNGELGNVFTAIFGAQFRERLPYFIETTKGLILEYKSLLYLIGAIFICFGVYFAKKEKKLLFRNITIFILLGVANSIYIVFLYSVCNTMITIEIAVEALRRYLLTLIALYLFAICFSLIYCASKQIKLNISIILIAILYITTPASWQAKKLIKKDYTNESIEYRDKYTTINEKINKIDIDKDVIYYIKEIEGDIYLSNFSVFPMQLSHMPEWSKEATIEEYTETLFSREQIALFSINTQKEQLKLDKKKDGNIYIYIYKVTDFSKEKYGKLFEYSNIEMQDETLYLVNKVNNIAKLTIVE